MLNKNIIQRDLQKIIRLLAIFVSNKKNEEKLNTLAKGELFNLIRRHAKKSIMDAFNGFTINNIYNVIVKDGVIKAIKFQATRYDSRRQESLIYELDDILIQMNVNYEELVFDEEYNFVLGI